MAGYVHVYTGDGKGKTTAALGLALRAVGAGWRVLLAQFAKGTATSELGALARLSPRMTVRQYGGEHLVDHRPAEKDLQTAARGLLECRKALTSGGYAMVILDEVNVALALKLLPLDDVLELIDVRPDGVELVLTGRWAHPLVVNRADLVTEMREVKHYYRQGVLARTGIEC